MAASDELGNSFKENSLEVGALPHQLYYKDPRRKLPINVWCVWDKHATDAYMENVFNLFKLQLL